jgi:RNA polymerase sigma-70 factor (ECF subfamily)
VTPFDQLDDEDVLAAYVDASRGRNDREAAFGAIVDRYERRVYAICYRQLGSHSDAQDATQDTFLHLARRAGQFRGDSKLSTFVYRVAVNACRDLQRKQARRPQTPVADVTQAQIHAGMEPDAAPDDVAARETGMQVEQALAQLDDLSRTLLILCAVEGHSYPEVAEILDMPVGTIKSRVFRARARLAELLSPEGAATPPAGPTAAGVPPPTSETTDGRSPRGPPAA